MLNVSKRYYDIRNLAGRKKNTINLKFDFPVWLITMGTWCGYIVMSVTIVCNIPRTFSNNMSWYSDHLGILCMDEITTQFVCGKQNLKISTIWLKQISEGWWQTKKEDPKELNFDWIRQRAQECQNHKEAVIISILIPMCLKCFQENNAHIPAASLSP